MKISILLPFKEDYSPKFSGAVSIHVSNLLKHSKFKKNIKIYGNTNSNKFLTSNYTNIKVNSNFITSNNRKFLNKFISLEKENKPNIIEIHNRPNYVDKIYQNLKSKIILYFHNDPRSISGSKTLSERINILNKCEFVFFNSVWTKNQFFKGIDENEYFKNFSICYQSTRKSEVNFNKKQKIITFIGKLNTAKGYDIFGNTIIKILDKYPDWSSVVVGDEPREKHVFKHKNLKIYNFKDNKFVLNLLKKASISVACSRWEEPFGRTSLEASSMGCVTIITNRGGLSETAKHSLIIKKLSIKSLFSIIEKIIKNKNLRLKIQKLNYKSFYLTNEFVSKNIDKIREKILLDNNQNIFNINKNSKLRIIHITNFNLRYFGRLQYNTGIRINNGLIRQGHNVLSLSDRDLITFSKSFKDPSGSKYLNNLVEKTVENFKPNLILLGHADRINSEMLLDIKSSHKNLKLSQWFLDPLSKYGPDYEKNKSRILNKNNVSDTTFITTNPSSLDFKIKNSFYMPNPCDKSLDYLENFKGNPDYDIFYAISHGVHRGVLRPGKVDERETFITKLKKKCNGVKFDTFGMFGKQPIWGNNFINKLSESKMGLNLSRGKPIKYYSSDRIAQLIGNGLLTFIDKNTQYSDFFNNDEMIFYKNIDDLSEKIIKYKNDDFLWRKIAKKGHQKYHKYFNSSLVAKYIIDRTFGNNENFFWDR